MNRNYENHFNNIPILEKPRSKFHMPKKHLTTFNVGQLIPFYAKLVYPGDNISIKTNFVARTSTPMKAPMDMSWIDTYYFFVPFRLVWKHFKEFMGENQLTAWEQPVEYTIPQITAPVGGWAHKTLADHFNIRPGVENISVTSMKFKMYARIYNDWFRNQNIQDGLMINDDDETLVGSNGTDYINDVQLGGMPMRVNKFNDYFTSCLPEPQKGPDVLLPLGQSAPIELDNNAYQKWLEAGTEAGIGTSNSTKFTADMLYNSEGTKVANLDPNGSLFADLTNATASTINNLRQAIAIQHLFELDARGGSLYYQIIENHFGVKSSDARLQRSEYLGGQRVPMNIIQVPQTSETTESSAQGNIASYSLTVDSHDDVSYAAEEHGYIIGLTCVRTNHTYQQGIAREDSYKDRLDFYWEALNGIGEQAVLNKEIFVQGTEEDEEVFGYQERYVEMKTDFNTISGEFRDSYEKSLKAWQYADYYNELPKLSPEWTLETPVNVDKTLQVTSDVADQIQADFYIDATYVRVAPMYSNPGLERI